MPGCHCAYSRADAGAGGQWMVQPAQLRFMDFHPGVPFRRNGAVLERQADAKVVQASVVAITAA